MIDKVLEVIRKEVNTYIDARLGGTAGENRVALTSFVDDTNNVVIPDDTVGLSLLNIEEEKHFKMAGLVQSQKSEQTSTFLRPPLNLNLNIMFASHFTQYVESLKHISYIIAFFQTKPYFDVDNTPTLATTGVERLLFDLNSITLEQLHFIWSVVGTRYLPSIVFKVRMLTVQDQTSALEIVNIQGINTEANKKEVND